MDAFDADVLIYSVVPDHPLGVRVDRLIHEARPGECIGSVLLVPELLIKPRRQGWSDQADDLMTVLASLALHPVELRTSLAAVDLGERYGLKTIDAVHLATAMIAGAERFITNNHRDFHKFITELDIVHPDDLPA